MTHQRGAGSRTAAARASCSYQLLAGRHSSGRRSIAVAATSTAAATECSGCCVAEEHWQRKDERRSRSKFHHIHPDERGPLTSADAESGEVSPQEAVA